MTQSAKSMVLLLASRECSPHNGSIHRPFVQSRFCSFNMLARLFTYSLFGIDAKPVEVEVDISPGAMPKTILVGLAEPPLIEARFTYPPGDSPLMTVLISVA